ncbi:MAG: LuxR family transcriptional regulator [Anaerolineae bacterium]|nr:LuxR family transcriptional regulator [Anaerolineae bacterium]
MSTPILATKLFIPTPRPKIVGRPRLIEQINEGLHRKLTLISAPAGFGKTTLVSEWVAHLRMTNDDLRLDAVSGSQIVNPKSIIVNRVAWLSLDEGDNEPARFLTYFVAALQTLVPDLGEGVLAVLQSPQPPPTEAILTVLLNEITAVSTPIILILDDYHRIDAQAIDHALAFLLDHLPPHMHLMMTTREDPSLPLARYRVGGQLTELRATDLRFTLDEATAFLNQAMGLALSAEEIIALETRTEGWIAGLQLAALSMHGQENSSSFIQSFTGSHRFILDYLVEEVLNQQSEAVQTFLLYTSILDRLCGPLCEAVLQDAALAGQETLAYLERANLFLVPLDNERHWYRYHHLFGDLLRQRLQQSLPPTDSSDGGDKVVELHSRASIWFEENGLEIEAFQHAAAAHDIDRAERLMAGRGMPLLFRGAVAPVMNWLASLETAVLNARPSLWVTYASAFLFISQIAGIEEKLQAAEAALEGKELDEKTRDLIGRIASMRATVAVAQSQIDTILTQSRIALDNLHPDNLPVRTSIIWNMGYAHQLQGDRVAAKHAYIEAKTVSEAIGHFIINIMSTIGVGGMQEMENQLHLAAHTYQDALNLIGEPPMGVACAAHLGLARIAYEWNDMEAAQRHGEQSLPLAQQFHSSVDRAVACEVFLARLKLAQGDVAGAAALIAKASQSAQEQQFVYRLPEVTAVHVLILLQQGNLAAAEQVAQAQDLPLSQARVYLAQGNAAQALAVLEPYRQQIETKGWADERLRTMVLQAIAYDAQGDGETAVSLLHQALTEAEPEGFIRTFIDEGQPMAELLVKMKDEGGRVKDYVNKLLDSFEKQDYFHPSSLIPSASSGQAPQPLVEPLSERELEVLQLVAQGLSNRDISEQLFLAVDTVKGHNRRIFEKLQVQNRTEAARRARELGLV